MKPTVLLRIPVLLVLTAAGLLAQSTIHPAMPYAFSANAGWITLRPTTGEGVKVGEYHLSGHAYGANFGWIGFGDGSPENGHQYANTSSTDSGVNQDGAGNLSGYAWSANTGWIHFGWASLSDPNRPRFDPFTGAFAGFAWSPNIGWINLGAGYLTASSVAVTDADSDGLGDEWEYSWFGKLTPADATTDNDGDGSPDRDEYAADTNPLDPASRLTLRMVSAVPAGDLIYCTLEWPTRPGRLYRLENRNNLGAGAWTVDSTINGTGALMTELRKSSGARDFYRIAATPPLR